MTDSVPNGIYFGGLLINVLYPVVLKLMRGAPNPIPNPIPSIPTPGARPVSEIDLPEHHSIKLHTLVATPNVGDFWVYSPENNDLHTRFLAELDEGELSSGISSLISRRRFAAIAQALGAMIGLIPVLVLILGDFNVMFYVIWALTLIWSVGLSARFAGNPLHHVALVDRNWVVVFSGKATSDFASAPKGLVYSRKNPPGRSNGESHALSLARALDRDFSKA